MRGQMPPTQYISHISYKQMKKTALFVLSFMALLACKKTPTETDSQQIQIVNIVTDSTKYGVVLHITNDSLKWTPEGEQDDARWINILSANKLGTLDAGHRIAVLFNQDSNTDAKSIIDITELIGRWVEPDAVDIGSMQGIELQEGGVASSINGRNTKYLSWSIYNGKLLLENSIDGFSNVTTDTFYITYLSPDSMRVTTSMNKHYFRRSNSDEDDVMREYDDYFSPEMTDFNPEGEIPAGAYEEEIPEFDQIF